ncbi:MAG: DUF6746 family protein [Halofilum sp. (in: g-proteobacteria)]
MRTNVLSGLIAVMALLFTSGLAASDVEHYSGKKSENLEQAMTNLREYNERLADLLAKDELTNDDLARIHKLSYTLENALARIDKDLDTMAEVLETVHLASERGEVDKVRGRGQPFVEYTRTLTGE